MLAVCNLAAPNVPKAPKPSSIVERVPQGTKPGAKPGHKKQSTSSKKPYVSSREAIKCGSSRAPIGSKTGHSQKSKESSSTMDSNPRQPSVSTLVDTEMHKEDQQAAGDSSSLGATSEEGAHPQLSSGSNPSVLVDKTKSVGDGLKTAHTTLDTKSAFFTSHSPTDEPIIILDESKEEEDAEKDKDTKDTSKEELEQAKAKAKAEAALLKAQPSFLNVEQLNELLVKSLKTEFSNILSAHDFSSSLPTELKNLPSKFNKLTEEVNELKNQVYNLEIELPGDLKEIPTKPEDFTKTVTSLTSQVAKLKTLQCELPQEFLSLPGQVLDSASSKAGDQSVPSAGQADTMPAEGEKNTNQATISQLFQRRAEKVNLNRPQPKTTTPPPILPVITTTTTQMQSPSFQLPPKSSSQPEGEHIKEDKGKKALSSEEGEKESTESGSDDETTHMPGSMVESSKKKELKKFDFVTESGEHVHLTKEQISAQKEKEEEAKAEVVRREGEIRKEELIDLLGFKVVNKKGPITLKVYREDGTSEIIPNFKASDLHLGEWREVMEACPKRTRKGWEIIYKQIGTRMDYIHTTEAELGINLDIPLSKQDPLDKLNDLANKKRKHADDIHDYFKANKRLKSSVQYEDHLPGTVLNEPVLGMILFNSHHRQDFVTIEDFRDFPNTMLYIVQEIFFRLHQGPGLDDHARTFSSLLLAEIDKRNLNPLKQMRVIEQLRQ
ncbi:hypothetical protein Tco_0731462 [Tanacetum coccineum]